MGRFVVGQVVIIPFPYSDLSGNKRRPALVVAELGGEDNIVCQLTTQMRDDGYSVALSQDDFVSGGLYKPSNIRPNRLFTVSDGVVVSLAGKVNVDKIREVLLVLKRIFPFDAYPEPIDDVALADDATPATPHAQQSTE